VKQKAQQIAISTVSLEFSVRLRIVLEAGRSWVLATSRRYAPPPGPTPLTIRVHPVLLQQVVCAAQVDVRIRHIV
jgi:hypothetical protein